MWLIKVNPNGPVEYFRGYDSVLIPVWKAEEARDLFARRYEIETEEERRAFKARGELCRAEGYVFQDVRSEMPGLMQELKGGRSIIWEKNRKGGAWWEHRWIGGVEVEKIQKFFGVNPRFWQKWREVQGQDDYGVE